MKTEEDFEAKEAALREALREQARRAIALRSKDREFHGVEREFLYLQAQMLADYERSRDLKHPRDVGDVRETLLRNFFSESGYTPKKYCISTKSVRVASPTGHICSEIDIAFYDYEESLTLMKRQDVYEVYPVECVYGVIQVKSVLSKIELQSALKNLASFKGLTRSRSEPRILGLNQAADLTPSGFAILFAYSSQMAWMDISAELILFQRSNPSKILPNAIFILDRGYFLFGDGSKAEFQNQEIERIDLPVVHGFPDRQGYCLYQLQEITLALLRNTSTCQPNLNDYFRLPLVAQDKSYSFSYGAMSEIGVCPKHGDYARKIPAASLATIVAWCKSGTPMNWIRATDIAHGRPADEVAYKRQPGDVYIYNPDALELRDAILAPTKIGEKNVLAFAIDAINTDGITIWIPRHYSAKYGLISGCPKCSAAQNRPKAMKTVKR